MVTVPVDTSGVKDNTCSAQTSLMMCFSYWRETFFAVVNRHLKSGGLFVFTCATTGRPEHGTRRTSPQDAPFVGDYYCNLTEKDYRALVNFDTIFRAYGFKSQTWPADLYFWGIKH